MIRDVDPISELTGLRALARSLVHGEADADDLLQDAAVALLEHPPELDRPVRPWLATVIVNRWRMNRRSTTRRRAREAAVETLVPDAVDPGERAEMLRRLGEAVTALAEPYRYTVIARYFDGKTSMEIAQELGIPAVTVRTRLARALDQLRDRLDEQAPRRRWQRVLVPVPVKASWFATAKAGYALVAVLLALLAAGAYAVWPRAAHPLERVAEVPPQAAAVRAEPVPAIGARVERVTLAGGAASGRVVDRTSGDGIAGAELTFTGPGGAVTIRSGDDGAFELAPANPGDYTLAQLVAPGYLSYAPDRVAEGVHVALARGRAVRGLVVYAAPAIDVKARVVDELGRAVGGARVAVIGDPTIDAADASWTSDRDGAFTFHAAEGAVLEAAAGDRVGWARVDANILVNRHVDIAIARVPPRVEVIAGRVVNDAGAPVENAIVHAFPDKEMIEKNGGGQTHAPAFAYTDATGAFEVRGLDHRQYEVTAEAEGHATAFAKHVTAGTRTLALALGGGERLAGIVVAADGTPVPSYALTVSRRDGAARDTVYARTIVDPDGKFALAVAPGRYDVEAEAAGFAPATIVASPNDAIRIALAAGRTLRGKVVSASDGTPLARARVVRDTAGWSAHGMPASLGALTGADGQFELAGIPPGPFTVTISAERYRSRIEWRTAGERTDPSPIVASLAPLPAGAEPHTDYVGIGITSTADGDDILIEMVTPGGGAEAAGIKAGDRIVTIDGVAAAEIGEPASAARIRGMPNTTVTLGIRRGDRVVPVVVTRSQVQS